jgi:hypothetical protein
VSIWVSQLVFLIISLLDVNKDSEVVLAGADTNAGACELGADLIESPRGDSPLGAVNVEGRDWGMMGGLFGEVADFDFFVAVLDAGGADAGEVLFFGDVVIDIPTALEGCQ